MNKFIQKLSRKTVNLYKIELIYASIYLLAGKILDILIGKGITILSTSFLTTFFTILLIIFFVNIHMGKKNQYLLYYLFFINLLWM